MIISGTGAAIWSKTNFGLIGHHHHPNTPLPRVCTVPRASAIFLNASWKSSSVRVISTACEASFTSVMSNRRPIFYWGNRKFEWDRDDSHIVFWPKIPWWRRKCDTVRCRDATASSFVAKVRGEVFAHFHALAVKRLNGMRN
jgi:hypothetical protein